MTAEYKRRCNIKVLSLDAVLLLKQY